ncbi:MAG: tetratricopeptide repeat protein [Nitrospira sp.]|nr:tetratricopeptide repeat protein [Nitrospira sp.]
MGDQWHGIAQQETGESTDSVVSVTEWYERGLALKKAGLYKAAIDQFERAAADTTLAVKAYAQIGLCLKIAGQGEEAVTAFRKALAGTTVTSKERVQVLYLLGRTLESLGRIEETLEAYRWIRREDPAYRDVAARIEQLSERRPGPSEKKSRSGETGLAGSFMKLRQTLLGTSK